MRNVTARTVLLSGGSTLVLAATIGPVLAEQAHTRAHTEITKSAHYARHWQLHRTYAASRERVRSPGYARVTIDVSILGLGPATKPTCYLIVS